MEVILFASLYRAKEIFIFYVHFLLKNFLSTWRDRSGVLFLPYKKASGDENSEVPADLFSSPVVGLHSVGRFISGRFCRVCLGTGEFLWPQGAIPLGLFGGGYCLAPEAPQKGECRRGRRYFGLVGRVWASALRPSLP